MAPGAAPERHSPADPALAHLHKENLMFRFIRSRLLYAGTIGWLDGRRGYPAENDYVELPLRRPPQTLAARAEPDRAAAPASPTEAAAAPIGKQQQR